MKNTPIIPTGHKFGLSKSITQLGLVLLLFLPVQTCNASVFDDILDYFKPLWTTNEVAVVEQIDVSPALAFKLIDINGNIHTQNDSNGKYLIINFWATWCTPCLKEIPAFVEFYANNSDSVEILGLNYEPVNIEAINAFSERFNIDYPIILYGGSNEAEYAKFGNLMGMPTTLIYSPDGELLHTFIGEIGIKELAKFIPTDV